MNSEPIFHLLVILLVGIAASVSIYYRRKAQVASGDNIDRRMEGDFSMIALRFGGLLTWLTILAYMIYPPLISWAVIPIPAWTRWTGVVTATISVGLLIWMFNSLGANITDTVAIRKSHTLVTQGPYRWIRHPLYTFGALLFVSLSLIMGSWLILAFGLPTFWMLYRRTGLEESTLLARFGDDYRRYAGQTGRFLPRIG